MHFGFLTLRLDRQQLRLSLHLQVLILPIPLSSLTAVTTYASSMRTSIRNLIIACRKNLQRWLVIYQIPFRRTCEVTRMDLAIDSIHELTMYGKSLFAGPGEVLSMDLAIS